MSLAFAVPTEWWLEILPELQTRCWQASQTLASLSRTQETLSQSTMSASVFAMVATALCARGQPLA